MNTVLEADQVEYVKTLIRSNELTLVFEIMKEKYAQSWMNTKLEDEEHRKHLYRMISAVEALKAELTGIALDQAVTQHNNRLRVVQGGSAINKGR